MAADDDLDLDVEGGGKSGGSKMMIIIIAVVVLLLISGGATFFLMSGGDKPAAEAGAEGEEAAAEEPAIPAGAPMGYFPMSPAFVVNFSGDSDIRFLQVDVQVGSRDPAMLELVREHSPAVRNSLVILFSSQNPEDLESREGKEKLRADVLEEIKKILKEVSGRDAIENVYFTSFVMQ